ncbi:uncharacterized protein N7503_011892 [Penicillium pulvis]|uniref:uncharacterized protein n=1 Tax=Penicillium pulvis TaxID=1562058 RepID=UPI0025488FB4|nr:uncharacterized protein N7503_011892 [Penicillium pulvis]KAJ5786680.1 hypothetical protein N7503_011892 [Penicillium pulvis]
MESGANKGPGMTAASIALTVIAVVIFALRAYSQRLVTKLFHLDEVFLFIGLLVYVLRHVFVSTICPNKAQEVIL